MVLQGSLNILLQFIFLVCSRLIKTAIKKHTHSKVLSSGEKSPTGLCLASEEASLACLHCVVATRSEQPHHQAQFDSQQLRFDKAAIVFRPLWLLNYLKLLVYFIFVIYKNDIETF